MKQSKVLSRQQRRSIAHTMTSREDKVRTRWSTGGFPAPGSRKKPCPSNLTSTPQQRSRTAVEKRAA